MSDQFPSLEGVIDKRIEDVVNADAFIAVDAAKWLAECWREACTVTTVAGLDELPDRVTIIDASNNVYGKEADNNMSGIYGTWLSVGYEVPFFSSELDLPARVIHHPDWETK